MYRAADASASEGYYTVASGFAGHAEGYQTTASAYASSAGGYYTVADQVYQTAVGKYNSAAQTGVLFAVGNGTAIDMRSDALQIHEDGHAAYPLLTSIFAAAAAQNSTRSRKARGAR